MVEQKILALTPEDAEELEARRDWVRNHYTPEALHKYDTVDGKIRLLETIIKSKWVEPDEKGKQISLGVTLGDAFAQELGLIWVIVEDHLGRDAAVYEPQHPQRENVLFPRSMIWKRVERDEFIDIRELFDVICNRHREDLASYLERQSRPK
jgi:Domain of unknown function (DUF3806)